jgi:hypothetical protein
VAQVTDDVLGWVVVEWNQASHQPDLGFATLHDDPEWAIESARQQWASARSHGRGERYTVHAVMAEEIEEDQ